MQQDGSAAGNLQTNDQQKVTYVQTNTPQPYIEIDNAAPDYVYVPVYDPFVTFGVWRYPHYRFKWQRPQRLVYSR